MNLEILTLMGLSGWFSLKTEHFKKILSIVYESIWKSFDKDQSCFEIIINWLGLMRSLRSLKKHSSVWIDDAKAIFILLSILG